MTSDAFASLLVDVAIKGAVLLLLAGAATLCMPRAAAATRHAVWTLSMAGLVLLPVLSMVLPGWRVLPAWAHLPAGSPDQTAGAARATSPETPERATGTSDGIAGVGARDTANEPAAGSDVMIPAETSAPLSPGAPTAPGHQPVRTKGAIRSLALGAWAIGALLALVPLLLARLSLARLKRTSRRIDDGQWARLLEGAGAQLGLKRRVDLRESPRRRMPMIWGVFRPTLLLPREASSWAVGRRRVVLLHELAHVRRRDCLTRLISQIVCAAYWFNPLVWLAARRMAAQSERSCDDLVLAAGSAPADYAEHILQIASGLRTSALAGCAGIAMAHRSKIEGRLLAILDARRKRRIPTRTGLLLAALLLAGVILPLSALQATGPSSPRPVAPEAGRAKVMLPGGVAVELVAVGYHPAKGKRWWDANGSPHAKARFSTRGAHVSVGALAQGREFVVRLKNLPKDASTLKWRIEPCPALSVGEVAKAEGDRAEDLRVVSAALPKSAKQATVTVGLAYGPWKTLAGCSAKHGLGTSLIGGGSVAFGKGYEVDGDARVTVTHNALDRNVRIIAVDVAGREHSPGRRRSMGLKQFAQIAATFPGLALAKVARFRFQGRPYRWVQFKNVSLEPGRKTVPRATRLTRISLRSADARIRAKDVLKISVVDLFREGESATVRREVSPGGHVSLPLLKDKVRVQGLSQDQAREAIVKAYGKAPVLKNAIVSVTLVPLAKTFSVLGGIRRSGVYNHRQGMRLLEALALAGDTNHHAKRLRVIRAPDPGKDNAGAPRTQTLTIDIRRLRAGDPRANILILPNDTISIPPIVIGEFYVMGKVRRPGVYSLTGRRITVKMALAAAAAGLLPGQKHAILIRHDGDDKERILPLKIEALLSGQEPPIVLQPNDLIVVGIRKGDAAALFRDPRTKPSP